MRVGRERGRREKKAGVLAEYGYDFEMPPVRDVAEVPERAARAAAAAAVDDGAGPGEAAVEDQPLEKAGARPAGKKSKRVKGKKRAAVTE